MILRSTILALAVLLPAALFADPPRTSMMLLGGAGGYQYEIQPTPGDVVMYSFLTTAMRVSPTSPLKLLADIEQSSAMEIKAKSQGAKFLVEKFFLESGKLGMTIGVAHSQVTETCTKNCGDMTSLLMLSSMSSGSSSSALMMAMMLPSMLESPSSSYTYTTFDLGLNFHFAPGAGVDPYLGANVGVGTCAIPGGDAAIMCTSTKYGPRAGIRFNFTDSLFMMVQGEADYLQFSVTSANGGGTARSPVPNKHAMLGVGFNI